MDAEKERWVIWIEFAAGFSRSENVEGPWEARVSIDADFFAGGAEPITEITTGTRLDSGMGDRVQPTRPSRRIWWVTGCHELSPTRDPSRVAGTGSEYRTSWHPDPRFSHCRSTTRVRGLTPILDQECAGFGRLRPPRGPVLGPKSVVGAVRARPWGRGIDERARAARGIRPRSKTKPNRRNPRFHWSLCPNFLVLRPGR